MSRSSITVRTGPSLGAIVIHTALTFLTGGLWLVVLAVRYLLC